MITCQQVGGLVMMYAFTNQKGGVGKSTLAVHFAVWLKEQGADVAVVDADKQGSSSMWLAEADGSIPCFRLLDADSILKEVPQLAKRYSHLVIDGQGGSTEATRACLFLTDVALMPCGPSLLDLRPADESVAVIKQVQGIRGGPPLSLFIPNKLKTRRRLSKDFLTTIKGLDIFVTSGLRELEAYPDSVGQGTVVWRLGKGASGAACEIISLFNEVMEYVTSQTVDDRRVENA